MATLGTWRVGFVGMGIMGLPMARRLWAAGADVVVHTRTRARAEGILSEGARWARTAREAAEGADVVFVCVTDTADVRAVILGAGGVAEGARGGTVVVDHSTISPAATREMAATLAGRGVAMLDAPVSGGDVGARDGTLSIMVGGDEAAFERVRPLLAVMGKTITYCGASGSGQLTKLVNQILVSVNCVAAAEALAFAKKNGLDPEKTMAAVGGGAAASWQLAKLGPRMIAGDFAPGFMVDLLLKDLRLIAEAAQASGAAVLAAMLARGLMEAAPRRGMAGMGRRV